MPQHIADIRSYTVDISRSLDDRSHSEGWRRRITLSLSPGRFGAGTTIAEFYFINKEESELFRIAERNQSTMSVYLTVDDFSDFYSIVQTEKPLVLVWEERVNSPRQSFLQNWRVTTSAQEPLGEGDTDN